MGKPSKLVSTIKREMSVLSVLSFLVVSLVISCVFLVLLYDENVKNVKTMLLEGNSQVVTFVQGMFHENAAMLAVLAQDDVVVHAGTVNEAAALTRFDTVQANNPKLTYVYSGYANGSLCIRDYNQPAGYNATLRPWYQAAMETDGVAQLLYSDAATGGWMVCQSIRLKDAQGATTGVLAIDCSNESVTEQLGATYRFDSQRSFIVDTKGNVLIHPNTKIINSNLNELLGEDLLASISPLGDYTEYRLDGVLAMAFLQQIPDTDFIVVTAVNKSVVTLPLLRNLILLLLVMIALSVALGILMSRVYIRRFAQPLRELSGRIHALASGTHDSDTTAGDIGTSNAEMQGIASNIELLIKEMDTRDAQRKAAEHLNFHDALTGLYNRRFFEEELTRLDKKRNMPLCVLCCDINGTKLVNDAFGRAMGDRLILTVARCLQKALREDDILSRINGDEFFMVLPHTVESDVQLVINRIRAALPQAELHGAPVTLSFGYALKTDFAQPIAEVIRDANKMAYQSKQQESLQMKQRTVENIIGLAVREGVVRAPNEKEQRLLTAFSNTLALDANMVRESYRLRRLGTCSALLPKNPQEAAAAGVNTTVAYNVLSALPQYQAVADCILHHTEHCDGSGKPSGLAEQDIPIASRVLAVVEAYAENGLPHLTGKNSTWYDKKLVTMLERAPEENKKGSAR